MLIVLVSYQSPEGHESIEALGKHILQSQDFIPHLRELEKKTKQEVTRLLQQ